MSVKSYRDRIAWQKAMDLAVAVFRMADKLPGREVDGIASQMRRPAVSVPSNIAEGQGRGATKEFIRFLRIARGPIRELETQLTLAQRLGYIPADAVDHTPVDTAEASRLISGLLRALGN